MFSELLMLLLFRLLLILSLLFYNNPA